MCRETPVGLAVKQYQEAKRTEQIVLLPVAVQCLVFEPNQVNFWWDENSYSSEEHKRIQSLYNLLFLKSTI